MSDDDITVCYDMSLKDFEHSGVHDLFKVCHCFFPYLSLYYYYCYFCLV